MFFCEEISYLPHLQVFITVPKILVKSGMGNEPPFMSLKGIKHTRTLSGHLTVHSTELWEAQPCSLTSCLGNLHLEHGP